MTTITSDISECYTIHSDPIAASVIEEKYLWWPVGVKWPPSPPTLVEASTNVTVLKDVCTSNSGIKNRLTSQLLTLQERERRWLAKLGLSLINRLLS